MVDPLKNKTISFPEILYKYSTFERVKEILTSNKIYFPSPNKFNDPFDFNLPFFVKASKSNLVKKFKKSAKSRGENLKNKDAEKEALDLLRDIKANGEGLVSENLLRTVNNGIGVLSLSEVKNDTLMFSHYGDGHKGVCIGFSLSADFSFFNSVEERVIIQVNYLSSEDLDPPNWGEPETVDLVKWEASTKSMHWAYEKEWRVVDHNTGEGFKPVKSEVITEIIFGCLMPNNQREEIIKIVNNKNLNLYACEKAIGSFELFLKRISF